MTLLLKKDEVAQLINMKNVISAVEEAYRAFSSDKVEQPAYIGIHLPSQRGEIDFISIPQVMRSGHKLSRPL